jgi:hypothetical protein
MTKNRDRIIEMVGQLLLFTRDPGAANQLIALHELLNGNMKLEETSQQDGVRDLYSRLLIGDNRPDLMVYAKDFALPVWQAAGIAAGDWNAGDASNTSNPDKLAELLHIKNVISVATGTSDVDDQTDHEIWRACKLAGIPCCAIVDSAHNLLGRFRDLAGTLVLPDHIYLHDHSCCQKLQKDGLKSEILHVIGDLHHDRITARGMDEDSIREIREAWEVDTSDFVVLFLSDCATEMKAAGRNSDYDEFVCLQRLLDELSVPTSACIPGRSEEKVTVIIRPHPKDTIGKYDSYRHDGRFSVRISSAGAGSAALRSADFVTGMKSALLREAAMLKLNASSILDWA